MSKTKNAKKSAPKAKPATAKNPARGTKTTTDGNLTVVETEPAKVIAINGSAGGKQAKANDSQSKQLSAIDAAAKLLASSTEAMGCKQMIDAMATKGLWKSPGGKTPHATLYSAILREVKEKGKDARFKKTERGRFVANG